MSLYSESRQLSSPIVPPSFKRTYLTEQEVEQLLKAGGGGRHGVRNQTMIRMMFRHGLRLREALDMKLEQIDIENGRIYIRRLKNGVDTFHYVHRDDLKYLKLWMQERTRILKKHAENIPLDTACLFFLSSTGKRLSSDAVQKLLKILGQKARFSFKVHPHMLRHSCGYALANRMMDTRNLQDYLGHRNISQTVKYTASNPARFARAWG